jgi:hypothetical protein
MADLLYPKFKEALLTAGLDLEADTIKAVLIDTADYTYSAAHDFLDDVPAAARVGTAQTLGSKTITNGVFDAGDITFPTVAGDVCEAILIYKDSGVEGTSNLIALIDSYTGLPVTPNGGNIGVTWPSDSNKIFAL